MKKVIILPILRLDWALPLYHELQSETDFRSHATKQLAKVCQTVASIRSKYSSAAIAATINPTILSWISMLSQSEACGDDNLQMTLAQFQHLVDSGAIEIIPVPLVKGVTQLSSFSTKLHFFTVLADLRGTLSKCQSPESTGLAGLSMAELNFVSAKPNWNFHYAVCDESDNSCAPPYVVRSDDGVICFRIAVSEQHRQAVGNQNDILI